MPALSLAQTLHGYDGGHRLLAAGGDVDERELGLLERLSDLSGYLPPGTSFESYFSGFPCGRYYAFACTWLDVGAVRGGTVLTHSLLVPLSAVQSLDDLWCLARSFRRPESSSDRSAYERSMVVTLSDSRPPMPDRERARDILALVFGQKERPILWIDEEPGDDIVRCVWSILWTEARRTFAFSTFALQLRSVERRPFDLLIAPPSARSAFHDRAESSARWEQGKLRPSVRAFAEDPWISDLSEHGRPALEPLFRWISEQGLLLPQPFALREAHRLLELAGPAGTELTAARARADLLFWIWPNLSVNHPLAVEVLGALLDHQISAPLAPEPLRELRDIVSRPAILRLPEENPALARRVEETLRREVDRRLRLDREGVMSAFSSLFIAAPAPWHRALVEGLLVQPGPREATLQSAAERLPIDQRRMLFALATQIAADRHDVTLTFDIKNVQAAPEEGLREAARLAGSSMDLSLIHDLAEVSERAPRTLAVEMIEQDKTLARPFVRLAITEGRPAASFLETVLPLLSSDDALNDEIRDSLCGESLSRWAGRVTDHIAPLWVRGVGTSLLAPERAALWLRSPPMVDALARLGNAVFPRHEGVGGWLYPLAATLVCAGFARMEGRARLVEALLFLPLDDAKGRDVDRAAEALAPLLDVNSDEAWVHALAARCLEAVRRTGATSLSACRIVERAFPRTYSTLVSESAPFSIFWPSSWFSASWDRAKPWRAWITSEWLRNRWPPASFLRAMGDDHKLFRRLVRRLARTKDGTLFLQSLPEALREDPHLARKWTDDVREAVEDPEASVDYE